jgi:3-deoxy-D-manno-octulosonate 8-phosphate phosphatase (KDO 8-P phosphatase)
MNVKDRAAGIKLIVFDVDGVLTSGQIFIGSDGEIMKQFNAQDGLGITAARRAGLQTAIITGRKSEIVRIRGEELKISEVCQGIMDKAASLRKIIEKYAVPLEAVAYVGDDLNDLSAFTQVGLACAVANAVPEVKARAHYVATHEGGNGGVREIVEFILKTQGRWQDVVELFLHPCNLETNQ